MINIMTNVIQKQISYKFIVIIGFTVLLISLALVGYDQYLQNSIADQNLVTEPIISDKRVVRKIEGTNLTYSVNNDMQKLYAISVKKSDTSGTFLRLQGNACNIIWFELVETDTKPDNVVRINEKSYVPANQGSTAIGCSDNSDAMLARELDTVYKSIK